MKAIQDLYAAEYAHCFGCGPRNAGGHHLKSYVDGDRTIAHFTAEACYSGGVPNQLYGGMIASLLDCHGTASAAAFLNQQRGRTPELGLPRCVTASLRIDFKRPAPLETQLTITGALQSIDRRKVWVALHLHAGEQLCATGEMLAIELQEPAQS
ncbi:PaaI family thioesterase [Pseudorhodoferax soli]|uniref:Acyl-coenzyme A thioesterase THEM4 n=1 Tax=Pseudorhodoferax soli TaxID=545864 RepID=A0A368XNQ7_9BURK|nr:PaaI family thioesterase [Pseudorhodoferax soli]RCW68648.1 thioesterase superfamily protein [Pseudorhodoferax soli]